MATGFVSLIKFRQMIKEQTMNTRKLDKLMIKISIFSTLYFVPITALIACYLYEVRTRRREGILGSRTNAGVPNVGLDKRRSVRI